MTLSNILTKIAGAGAIFLSAQDAHRMGIAGKNKYPQQQIAKEYPDEYINTQRLNMEALPTVVADAKKSWFNVCLDDTFMPAFNGVVGYVKGFVGGLVNNVVPLALGSGALLMSKSDKISSAGTKLTNYSVIRKHGGKLCVGLMAIGALKIFLHDICGFGQYKKL